ncbi:unnamed protein product [Thelazia callipaeda]|uniref:Huntingtin n=1 Tax=Thelazia callipaeda TaxID=103827 RepID=A0A0N5CUP1_THECL|nr:unnamed protein product [Thelazia callipaeda]
MERLSKALNVLQTAKKSSWIVASSRKSGVCEKERAAFSDIKNMLIQPEVRGNIKYNDEFNRAIKVMFEYMSHWNSDIRMLSEQTIDSVLKHLVTEMNSSRVVVALMSEIKRNGSSRSLVFSISRFLDALKYVKINRSRVIGLHLISALIKILPRPEEAIQSALEKYLPSIFTFFGSDLETQKSDLIVSLYEAALVNLELSGVANRTAAVVISQLATYVELIRRRAFSHFCKILAGAHEQENKNFLVGTLNSLRLMWPICVRGSNKYDTKLLQSVIRDSLRCLFSPHNEIVVASLEFLEKILISPLQCLNVESFYPQKLHEMESVEEEKYVAINSLPSSHVPSCMSSLRASPVNFLFGNESESELNSGDDCGHSLSSLASTEDSIDPKRKEPPLLENGTDVVDPLRHLELSSGLTRYSTSSEESLHEAGPSNSSTTIPKHLPEHLSSGPFLTYTVVLLTKRFLLSGQRFRLLTDREVRVSHKLLAMSCVSNLALYLPEFTSIPLGTGGDLGIQTLKDLQLYLNHEDDHLKASAVFVFVNAENCRFRTLGKQFHELHCLFTSLVYDIIHLKNAHCSRALLTALKSAKHLVYETGIICDIARFACSNYRDNYFLLRIAVVEYLASIEWTYATSPTVCLPDEIFEIYMHLLADDDERVQKAAAEHLPMLTENANYTSVPNTYTMKELNDYLCSDFLRRPMTTGMSANYDFVQQSINFAAIENLSFIIKKMFEILTRNADEKKQAGMAAGLFYLLRWYKSRRCTQAWGLKLNIDSFGTGLIISLISKCDCYSTSIPTFIHLLEIATQMTANLCTASILKSVGENKAVPEFPRSLCEQLFLLQLRVMNLYYSLIVDNRQQGAHLRSRLSPLSPVRKAIPGNVVTPFWEQRIAGISTLFSMGIKMTRNTSFLQSSSLSHFAESLRGSYLNYLNTLASDASKRFVKLLSSALNCLACTLEVMRLSEVVDIIKEIVLYCRTVVEIVPEESVRVVMQLFKILFGSNVANMSLDALESLKFNNINLSKDFAEIYIMRSANSFTEFVVNSGRLEFNEILLKRCTISWRKDLFYKDGIPSSAEITAYVIMFEPFVSLTIQLYQSTNSVGVQCSILDLLCVLVRGGINYSMLDPETRLLNFVIEQVNEIGERNRIALDDDEKWFYSVFDYLLVLSRTDSRGQVIMSWDKICSLVDFLIKSSRVRSCLAPFALISLQTVLLDVVGIRCSFDITLLKMLQSVDHLAAVSTTKILQLWSLAILGSHINGDAQNWRKTSLLFFECLQHLSTKNWDFDASFNATIMMRFCCTTITRPIDFFLKKMISILENDLHCFDRLVAVLPYLFVFLCVLKEDSTFTRIEQIYDNAAVEIGRLLMALLNECLTSLWQLTCLDYFDEKNIENLMVWFLLILSHALRSGNMECITSTFSTHFKINLSTFQDLSIFYPRTHAVLLSFLNVLGFHDHSFYSSSRHLSDLCLLSRCRAAGLDAASDIALLSDFCSPEILLTVVIRGWLIFHLRSHLHPCKSTIFQLIIDLDIFELVASTDIAETSVALKFLSDSVGKSAVLDDLIAIFLHSQQSKNVALKSLLVDMIKSERFSVDSVFKSFVETSELMIKDYNFKFGDPVLFSSDVFADLLQDAIGTKSFSIQAESVCTMLCAIEERHVEMILRKAYEYERYDVLATFIDMVDHLKDYEHCSDDVHEEHSSSLSQRVNAISDSFVSLAFDSCIDSPLQLFVHNKIAEKPESIICEKASNWATDISLFDYWMQRYADSLMMRSGSGALEVICAVTFGISRHSFLATINQAQNSKKIVEQQLSLAINSSRLIQKVFEQCDVLTCQKFQKLDNRFRNLKIIDRTGKKDCDIGFIADAIQSAFDVTQQIQQYFRKKCNKTHLYSHLENLAKAVIRMPFLNDISCIPVSALLCGWKPEPEIHCTSVSIPTVNIHYLGNVDILQDFLWRILWAGWNRRSNFDNFSMSLFGVISSTPSGSELASASLNVAEQLMASTIAIEGLTNLLLETLLYPERGNPVTGRFIVKPRDTSQEFLSSLYGQRLTMLQAKLLGGAVVDSINRKNLEIFNDQGKRYRPGQFSVLTSWNMAGLLDHERSLYKDVVQGKSQLKKRLPSSDSSYLLNSSHDTTYESCLRMLFDTYSHWFRAGIDAVPLPLLSATIKSMSLLSDLFTEMDQYRFVYTHMKTLFTIRSYLDNVDVGNIVYSLLKCVSILGIEDSSVSRVDAQKTVLTWVETGLISDFTEIRVRTLQGCLFLLQAISYDDLKPVFLLLESGSGLREYETLLWTVKFFFFDKPSYSSSHSRLAFINLVCEKFTAASTPLWLMDLLTVGVEKLIVGSRIYVLTFSRIAVQAMENYFNAPQKFLYAFRIFIACLYRGLEEGKGQHLGTQPYDSRIHLMEQHTMIFKILAEGAEEDALQMMKVLPFVLIDSLSQSELINSILKELIYRYSGFPHPRSTAIFTIIHHWFIALRSCETESVVLEWTLNGLDSFKYVADPALFRFYVSAFLCSSSPNPYIANLFYFVIGRTSNSALIDDCLFEFSVRSLLLRMKKEERDKLKSSLETFVANGKICRDPRRTASFPEL